MRIKSSEKSEKKSGAEELHTTPIGILEPVRKLDQVNNAISAFISLISRSVGSSDNWYAYIPWGDVTPVHAHTHRQWKVVQYLLGQNPQKNPFRP